MSSVGGGEFETDTDCRAEALPGEAFRIQKRGQCRVAGQGEPAPPRESNSANSPDSVTILISSLSRKKAFISEKFAV